MFFKNQLALFSFSFLCISNLFALDIFDDSKNSLNITGDIAAGYFVNTSNGKQEFTAPSENNNDSNFKLTFNSVSNPKLEVNAVVDFALINDNTHDYYNIFTKEAFIALGNSNFGTISIGKQLSLINSWVFNDTTNHTSFSKLDAGFNYNDANTEGSDFANGYMINSIVYVMPLSEHVSVGLQYQNSEEILEPRFSYKITLDDALPYTQQMESIKRLYNTGVALKYNNNIVRIAIGYTHSNLSNNIYNKYYTDESYSVSIIPASSKDVDIDTLSTGLGFSYSNFDFNVSAGYYRNLKAISVDHIGFAGSLSYNTGTVIPYIGYQYLFTNNSYGAMVNDNYIYSPRYLVGYNKKSIENNIGVLGVMFKAYNTLDLVLEYKEDFRNSEQRKNALKDRKENDIIHVIVRYNIV